VRLGSRKPSQIQSRSDEVQERVAHGRALARTATHVHGRFEVFDGLREIASHLEQTSQVELNDGQGARVSRRLRGQNGPLVGVFRFVASIGALQCQPERREHQALYPGGRCAFEPLQSTAQNGERLLHLPEPLEAERTIGFSLRPQRVRAWGQRLDDVDRRLVLAEPKASPRREYVPLRYELRVLDRANLTLTFLQYR